MGNQKAVTDDAVTTYLHDLFNTNVDLLRGRWKEYAGGHDGKGKIYKVYRDLQDQLPYEPSIEIVSKERTTQIFSIGTQEDRFDYNIIITVNNNHAEYSKAYLRILADAIMDLLNDFSKRNFQVPGYDFCVYFSEAERVDYGFRRGKGLKSANISWYAKLLKPNRMST